MAIAGYIFVVFGSIISLMNFYLSFLRYPVYRLCGGKKEDYKWVSGIPLFGSAFILIGMAILRDAKWILVSGVIIALLDTAGLHWFLGTLVYHAIFKRNCEEQ
ncbi:MAG: hypothetical protein OEV87_05685 [Phycisphaerae bacterium]|nr:hypothetical protein [Phycisphaerae bacterium]